MSNTSATYGEMLKPAMEIKTQEEAQEILEEHIVYHMSEGNVETEEEARTLTLSNIGYFAGYYDNSTMQRVWELFNTTHPLMPFLKES